MKTTRYLTQAALIAALYTGLTLFVVLTPFGTLSFGLIQIRLSEALTVLPALTPAAIPGLFVGCIVSNIVGSATGNGFGLPDIVFGSLASLLAAILSSRMKKSWLVPLPPVLVNAVVVGLILSYFLHMPWWVTMPAVGAGQTVACYGLGYPLLSVLRRIKLFHG